jgi:hypothetical protein
MLTAINSLASMYLGQCRMVETELLLAKMMEVRARTL